ncbi:hypothetical protein [Bacteroides finegoldii]|uniref:hypothetical protein n=1 Tax=Bacteroides finegoldii TaxID=338188 RepID=UPI0034A1E09B
MKKIWLLMLMVCTVIGTFTACSSDDDGDPTPQLLWGIERSGFFNGREKWAKGFENQRV